MSRMNGNVASERERKYEIAKCVQLIKAYRAFNVKLLIYRATLPAFEQLISLSVRAHPCVQLQPKLLQWYRNSTWVCPHSKRETFGSR